MEDHNPTKEDLHTGEILTIEKDGLFPQTAPHTDIQHLMDILAPAARHYQLDKIQKAYDYAMKLHEGQYRVSGEAYITHPIAVAEIVAELGLDTDSICAALLHDTVEDCADKTNLKEIGKIFGDDVAMLVDGLTKIVQFQIEDKEEAHIENLRKMLLAMSKDIRVIFIKLCDRLHNMRTLGVKPDAKRRITALETMQVYAPLAHRLGIQKIKQELENIGLFYLDPIGYAEVKKDIEQKYGKNRNFIENIRMTVSKKLDENHISYTLEGRIKSVYSIYKKMYNQDKSFDEIYDFYALRIIVETELECYETLGIIHEMFNSVPGRFKDYISTPKPNMYRSLHTTVIGRDGVPFEVQIRTKEMHHVAEYGVAAHWKYKSGATSQKDIDKKLEWVSRLIETEDDTRDPDEFMSALKTDIFHDEVFVFTPKGDVISLPQGSTVIDFAYAIHSAVGNKMIGAKINGSIVPIDRAPKNGEIVEIVTSNASKGPSRDWLKIVKTTEARNKIRQWFKKEGRVENIALGKAAIEAEFKRFGKTYTESEFNEVVETVALRNGFKEAEDLYNTIGYGGYTVSKISMKLRDELDRVRAANAVSDETETNEPEQLIISTPTVTHKGNGGVIVDGETGCTVKFAKCCNPLPGDNIIGFITRGFGVSIHKRECPNAVAGRAKSETRARWVDAFWENDINNNGNQSFEAQIQIVCEDRIGIFADISNVLADMRVPIIQINTQKTMNGITTLVLKIACKNSEHCNLIVSRLKTIKNVVNVVRGYSS